MQTVIDGLLAAVGAAEEESLPRLRDALIAAAAPQTPRRVQKLGRVR